MKCIFVDTYAQMLRYGDFECGCVIGKNGTPEGKSCDGDGKCRLGCTSPDMAFTVNILKPHSRFSHSKMTAGAMDTGDPTYNCPILPVRKSSGGEVPVYDVIIVLIHNDNPPIAPRGSAIFLYIVRRD